MLNIASYFTTHFQEPRVSRATSDCSICSLIERLVPRDFLLIESVLLGQSAYVSSYPRSLQGYEVTQQRCLLKRRLNDYSYTSFESFERIWPVIKSHFCRDRRVRREQLVEVELLVQEAPIFLPVLLRVLPVLQVYLGHLAKR